MKRVISSLLLALVLLAGLESVFVSTALSAESVESWKLEFDVICGQTDNAAEMSEDELRKALEKCEALKPKIEALEASPRKLYLKRLQMCRNLFAYLLERKQAK